MENSRIVLARLAESTNDPIDSFDAEKYIRYFDDCELSDGQKIDFLKVLWDIMSAFVDLGFGVDSVLPIIMQNAMNSEQCVIQDENLVQELKDARSSAIHGDCS